MHHNKSASIKFVAEFVGEERETAPGAAAARLCVPQNLERPESQCCGPESMRPQHTRARLRAVRLLRRCTTHLQI
jgi:hypothetical protein